MDGDAVPDSAQARGAVHGPAAEDAFAHRVAPYLPSLRRRLRRLLPVQDAEDVLQEVLLHAYICLPGLRRPELFGPWLRAVAHNRAMQWHRRRYSEAGAVPRLWHPDDGGGGVAEAEERADLAVALRLLQPLDREAVVLRYVHGWTSDEIGRLQGRLATTVRWRLQRARRALRAQPAAGSRPGNGQKGCGHDGGRETGSRQPPRV